MSSQPPPPAWGWQDPPFYALIRGPLGRAGYQVATVHADDRPAAKIVLLFSSQERAEAHAHHQPQGHSDWKVGPLPSWKRLHFFLQSMQATASRVCVDFERQRPWESYSAPLDASLLEGLAARAREEPPEPGQASG